MANLLSKVNIGGVTYNLKDAESRAKLVTLLGSQENYEALDKALGAAAWKAVAENISGTGLVDASIVKAYVDSQVGQIPSFDVVIDAAGTAAGPSVTASADTMYKIYMVPDAQASAGSYIEWITIRSGEEGAFTYAWEKIGSTKTDLTGYVSKDLTIAGIDLNDNITAEELKEALGLKALAFKESAAGTVAGEVIKGVKATGTSTGAISGAMAYTSTEMASAGKFTPAGSVTGDAIKGGSIEVTLKDAATASAATVTASAYTPAGNVTTELTESETGAFQIAGTVAAPTITVTPATGTVQEMKTSGTAYSITEGGVAKATDTKSAFATAGLLAEVDDTQEMLTFTAAGTSQAITAVGDITYTAPVLSGALPTFGEANVVTGIASSTATAPVFTGKKYDVASSFKGTEAADMKVTGVTYLKQQVDTQTFTGTAATLGFTGTEGDLAVTGNYDKANKGTLAFEGAEISLNVGDITVAEKEVTVR